MIRCITRLAQTSLVVVVVAACAPVQQLTAADAQADTAGQSSAKPTSHPVLERRTPASDASHDALAALDDDDSDEKLLGTSQSLTLLPADLSGTLRCHAQHAFMHERALTLERPPRG